MARWSVNRDLEWATIAFAMPTCVIYTLNSEDAVARASSAKRDTLSYVACSHNCVSERQAALPRLAIERCRPVREHDDRSRPVAFVGQPEEKPLTVGRHAE